MCALNYYLLTYLKKNLIETSLLTRYRNIEATDEAYIWPWACRRQWYRWSAEVDGFPCQVLEPCRLLVCLRMDVHRTWTVPTELHLQYNNNQCCCQGLETQASRTRTRTRTWAGINTHISCRHRARSHVISFIMTRITTRWDRHERELDRGSMASKPFVTESLQDDGAWYISHWYYVSLLSRRKFSRTWTSEDEDKTMTWKLVLEDLRRQGLSSRTTTLITINHSINQSIYLVT